MGDRCLTWPPWCRCARHAVPPDLRLLGDGASVVGHGSRTARQRTPVPRHGPPVRRDPSQVHARVSPLTELTADEQESRVEETHIAQPALLSVQAGLTALWRSWGVVPATVIGHSVGEIAAAHAAGILSLEDALLVAYQRSRLGESRLRRDAGCSDSRRKPARSSSCGVTGLWWPPLTARCP